MKKTLCLAIAAVAVTGCAKEVKPSHEYQQRVYLSEHNRIKDMATSHYVQERGGAAYREDSYQYVLGVRTGSELFDTPKHDELDTLPKGAAKDGIATPFSHLVDPVTALKNAQYTGHGLTQSYSIYEMKRWNRFCGPEKITRKDFEFIAKVGRANVPKELKANCQQPGFTRQDYLAAWDSGCSDKGLTVGQRVIRSQTVSPKHCK